MTPFVSKESGNDRYLLRSRALSLNVAMDNGQPAVVMGVLNVTPDSFSDGGQFLNPALALDRAGEMITDGAAIIDVGGASSRPQGSAYGAGASCVSPEEELVRVLPVIRGIAERWPGVMISIDTFSSKVAGPALEVGAHIVNDITGLRADPELVTLVARHDVPVVLMHSLGLPGNMPHAKPYENVINSVLEDLRGAVDRALQAGIKQIIIDPGFGFGKSTVDNMQLIASTAEFAALGWPVMIGVSRKSSIGRVLGSEEDPVPVEERLNGSLGASAAAVLMGAGIIRTHDVRATVEMLKVLNVCRPH